MFVLLIAGEDTYKLRLDIENLIALEKVIGKNPAQIITDVIHGFNPRISDVLNVLYYSLKSLQKDITMNEVYLIYEKYVKAGGDINQLIVILVDVLKNCGVLSGNKTESNDTEKNA